jgi:hypothetical protein
VHYIILTEKMDRRHERGTVTLPLTANSNSELKYVLDTNERIFFVIYELAQ